MFWTELVDFVVDFVSYPELFVVFGVVEDSLVDKLLFELIHNLDSVKVDESTIWSATGYVVDSVGLYADFHFDEFFDEGKFEVESGLS